MPNKYFIRLILFFSITLSLLFIFNIYYFFIRRGVGPTFYISKIISAPSDPTLELPVYQDLVEEYRILNHKHKGKSFIVFTGDSITKRFNIDEFFQEDNILNRGIYSDTTLGLKKRLDDNINNLTIDKLFIMIGYNDLDYRDNNDIVINILEIVKLSTAKSIYIQSILPVDPERQDVNQRIEMINESLKVNAMRNNYTFIDLSEKFKAKNGAIDPKLSRDGTHPNLHGYALWFSIIREYM